MPLTLLRPYVLSYKNRLLGRDGAHCLRNRELITLLILLLLMYALYSGTLSFLERAAQQEGMLAVVPAKLISVTLFAFFLLLLFSNCIAALGYLYAARDMPLLLSLPISTFRLYIARMSETVLSSSWMFLVFAIPTVIAYSVAFDLSWQFAAFSFLLLVPYLLIPGACATVIVTVFVNICPAHKIRELLLGVGVVLVSVLLFAGHNAGAHLVLRETEMRDMLVNLSLMSDPQPWWMPSRWTANLLIQFLPQKLAMARESQFRLSWQFVMLFAAAFGSISFSYLVFDLLFTRGWNIAAYGKQSLRIYGSRLGTFVGRMLIPFSPQLRALCYKEIRMFMRDATQSLHMLLLLLLTFIYLYNFRALRVVSTFEGDTRAWWEAILSLANLAFGSCIVSAIATRFVFPSISLEGNAYSMLRTAPLSIREFLLKKLIIWLVPVTGLSVILLVSGALAIQAPLPAIVSTAVLAVALSSGVVGLGIGIGAVYTNFDWDSPAQVTASFGSLIYMLLAVALTGLTLIPAAFALVLSSIPAFRDAMSTLDFCLTLGCLHFLVFYVNFAAARKALGAGEQHLRQLEK